MTGVPAWVPMALTVWNLIPTLVLVLILRSTRASRAAIAKSASASERLMVLLMDTNRAAVDYYAHLESCATCQSTEPGSHRCPVGVILGGSFRAHILSIQRSEWREETAKK